MSFGASLHSYLCGLWLLATTFEWVQRFLFTIVLSFWLHATQFWVLSEGFKGAFIVFSFLFSNATSWNEVFKVSFTYQDLSLQSFHQLELKCKFKIWKRHLLFSIFVLLVWLFVCSTCCLLIVCLCASNSIMKLTITTLPHQSNFFVSY